MKKITTAAFAAAATFALTACDVDQTEEMELPEVEVSEGNMPEFDVEPADVDVDTNIEAPTLDVDVDQDDAEGEPVTGDE
ncbi:hypothetical protein [Erythrobacter sp. MTPC3]|uniref:hypothetical protein n=1 Tax=Erythrobacter sp. MTPC3 TaxID=3056564 RepID=UPI0036F2D098